MTAVTDYASPTTYSEKEAAELGKGAFPLSLWGADGPRGGEVGRRAQMQLPISRLVASRPPLPVSSSAVLTCTSLDRFVQVRLGS